MSKKFSAGLSKLHSTFPGEHFEQLFFKHYAFDLAGNGKFREKKVYIVGGQFSFRNILRRKILIRIGSTLNLTLTSVARQIFARKVIILRHIENMESKIVLSNTCVFLPEVCQSNSRKRANIGCSRV